jgi:hypothetical protein
MHVPQRAVIRFISLLGFIQTHYNYIAILHSANRTLQKDCDVETHILQNQHHRVVVSFWNSKFEFIL